MAAIAAGIINLAWGDFEARVRTCIASRHPLADLIVKVLFRGYL
jgi:hypothetical protein